MVQRQAGEPAQRVGLPGGEPVQLKQIRNQVVVLKEIQALEL